jgi:predicted GNAT superfamily acetyltransferase
VVTDLCAEGVWHNTRFLLATRWQGQGVARPLYDALEDWARTKGARWLRLGAVVGTQRAERFWQRCGSQEVRQRLRVDTGGRLNDLRVMVKALGGGGLGDHLVLGPRDQAEADLP